jgi:signal transduction histidine kinase
VSVGDHRLDPEHRGERDAIEASVLATIVQDRLAAVGTLAAGVAHEINNPLAFVVANLAFAVRELSALRDAHPDLSARLADVVAALEEAQVGADRVRSIVVDLRNFARSEANGAPVDVHDVLESALKLISGDLRNRARLVKELTAGRLLVDGHEGRLGQALLALLLNASQAIPAGEPDTHEVRVTTSWRADGRACIEVRDTGAGIPEVARHRIFEPFYSSRPAEASGLGLSICASIVSGMGGTIEVESTPGEGSTFRVLLRPAGSAVTPQ